MSVRNNVSTDWLRAAQRPSVIGVVRRRGCPKQLNSQLNSTRRRVELCRYKRGFTHFDLKAI